MKILMTTMGLDIGGAETHIVELSKELHRRGHQIILASNGGVYVAELQKMGIRHVVVPMNQRSAGKMLKALLLLKKLIQQEQPDLVHAHARIPAFLCGILQKQMHFPFITSAHWVFQVTPLLRLMTDWGQRTVAVSEDIKSYLMENYQVPEDQIHVTINGIDTETFSPDEKNLTLMRELNLGMGPVIGTVSRLDESRELAARHLISIMPDVLKVSPTAQLLIVGGGNMEEILRQEAAEINRITGRDSVIMTGPRSDVAQLVSLCDVFVGVSRSALEAMAAGKPTILAGNEGYIGTFEHSVLTEAMKSNFCCRGFEACTPEKLLLDLSTLLRMSAEERYSYGEFGRQVVLSHYSVERMTNDYLEAYQQLLRPPQISYATISGYYGYGNLGDDAILRAISQQLFSTEHPVRLTVLSRRPRETARYYGHRAVQRFNPFAVYKALRASDVLISGGGSLLQDKTSTRSLLYYLAVIWLAKKMKKPVFLYANGVGPLMQERNRKRVCKCIDACDRITLRDEPSLKELQAMGVSRLDVEITGDPVFLLKPKGDQSTLSAYGIAEGASIIGVSVRKLPRSEHFIHEVALLCDRLVSEDNKTIVFLIMQESEDEAVSQQIRRSMTQPSYLIKTPGDPEAMLALIQEMELLVSMRLHTLVFAANVNVPVIGCVYDPKVSAMLDILGMPSCGTPDNMDANETYMIAKNMLSELTTYKRDLAERVDEITILAGENSRIFRQFMS